MNMDFENTDLILGFGPIPKSEPTATNNPPRPPSEPSLTLGLSVASRQLWSSTSSPNSAISSNFCGTVKVEKDITTSDDQEASEKISSKVSDEDEEGISCRKKLRLTKDQSALLENKFREHTTLNPKQKQALAKQLSLRPRQVEVWFQNRRARTKLKQTEMDCEVLKKCCETLSNENRRLNKELQALKSAASPDQMTMYHMHMPTSISLCPSCEK